MKTPGMVERVEQLTKSLQGNGLRITQARKAVIEALVASGGHVTADELARRVRDRSPHVGRMTVYRTLEALCDLGAVRPIFQGTGAAHYVLMDDGAHHHLICTRCHAVIEFDACNARPVVEALSEHFKFSIQSHMLEVHGVCEACGKESEV